MNHQNFKFKLIAIFLSFLSVISCETDRDSIGNFIIEGRIIDLSQTPVSNISIKKGEQVLAVSDVSGNFMLNKKNLVEGDVLTIEGEGVVTISRIFKNSLKLDNIFMKRREEPVLIASDQEQYIEYPSGLQLIIPENAFFIEGEQYNGEVQIIATFFDVTNRGDLMSAPGAFIAEDSDGDGNPNPLTSYGVMEIMTLTPDNIPLQLAEGLAIDISFPIDEMLGGVNLYSMNTITGYWKLEDVLVNNGDRLEGVITTVNSAWNADEPCADQLICIKVNIQYENGDPGCGIGATGVTYQGFDGLHSPDQNGDVELMVCPDGVFELGACWILCCGPGVPLSDPCCNNPQYRKTIDLSTITINPGGCTDIGTWVIEN